MEVWTLQAQDVLKMSKTSWKRLKRFENVRNILNTPKGFKNVLKTYLYVH